MSPSSVVSNVLERLRTERVVVPANDELESLLADAELREERDTGMAGPIRLLRVADAWLVQERLRQLNFSHGLPRKAI